MFDFNGGSLDKSSEVKRGTIKKLPGEMTFHKGALVFQRRL